MIVDGDGKRLRGLVGPYNEGEPLKLTCQAEHGTFKRSAKTTSDHIIRDSIPSPACERARERASALHEELNSAHHSVFPFYFSHQANRDPPSHGGKITV